MTRFYLTTAIDYANGEPHAGHAFEKVGADVIARYRRALGDDVHFVIGMDEHGQGIAEEAERRGTETQAFVDELAELWAGVWRRLEISNDDFIRTTEKRHRHAVEAIVEGMKASGDLYVDSYTGYYCVRCERFRKEEELVDGRCPYHPKREITWTEEENWFFRLSRYRDPLLRHLEEHPEFVQPTSRRNEILRLLEGGLDDISASRSRLPWGIPFPGADDHTVYVWIDALTNYLSATGYPDESYTRWWPAMLHIHREGHHPFSLRDLAGDADVRRRRAPRDGMGARLRERLGGQDLQGRRLGAGPGRAHRSPRHRRVPLFPGAGGALGRRSGLRVGLRAPGSIRPTLQRGARERSRQPGEPHGCHGRQVPPGLGPGRRRDATRRGPHLLCRELPRADAGLSAARGIEGDLRTRKRRANVYIDEVQPWQLAKEGEAAAERLDAALGSLVRCLRGVAAMLGPFMPDKAAEIWLRMGRRGWPAQPRGSGGLSGRHLTGGGETDDDARGPPGSPALSTLRA